MQNSDSITIRKQNPNKYYDIESKEIGKGAFGTVYRGKSAGSEGPWRAIKKIQKKAVPHVDMLINQIEVMSILNHSSIIKLYDIFQWKSAIYLVTDFCDGGQLFDKLEQVGTFSEQTAKIIFKQIIEGIRYIHDQNIAHRDLKPQNFLFLNKDSLDLKLIDFGLAFRWEQDMKAELKQIGQKKLVGTSYYLSPEVAKFQYDQKCDIWSAGVILYMLVSACPPFYGENDKQIISKIKKLQYYMNIPQFDGVSDQLKDLIDKILVPANKRISILEIFEHPWVKIEIPKDRLNLNFHKMAVLSKCSKLKALSNIFIASQCSQEQLTRLGKIFWQIDSNMSGIISIEELKNVLEAEINSPILYQLKELMDTIDTEKDGTINYTEFLQDQYKNQHMFSKQNVRKMSIKLCMDIEEAVLI